MSSVKLGPSSSACVVVVFSASPWSPFSFLYRRLKKIFLLLLLPGLHNSQAYQEWVTRVFAQMVNWPGKLGLTTKKASLFEPGLHPG